MIPTDRMCRVVGGRAIPLALSVAAACSGGDLELPSTPDTERLELIAGDDQRGQPGERLPRALVVRLVDGSGGGIPDRPVTWIVSDGGGEVRPDGERTDGEGYARADWTLGPETGTNTADAVVSHVGVVTFTATAIEGEPTELTIEKIEGDGQQAPAGSPVPVRPAVRVLQGGEPVSGVEVRFEVTAGEGTVEGAEQVTNADGIARVDRWVLGSEPGANRLEASGEGLTGSPVVFTAEGTAAGDGSVDRFEFRVQPPSQADRRERFRVEVAMVDEDGELVPLSGIVIYLGLFQAGKDVPNNSLLLGDRFRETVNGVAVFDNLGVTRPGVYRLRALTDDLPEHGPAGPRPPLFSDQFTVD